MNKPSGQLYPASSAAARFTAAEFLRMSETGAFDEIKIELVDGELERMNPPMSNHGNRQAQVMIRLATIVPEHLLMGEVGIVVSENSVLGCDVAVLWHAPDTNRILRPDDMALVVEVSETTIERDLGMKRIKYAHAGIAHYWVVDGSRSVTHVCSEPVDGDYAQIGTVKFGDPLPVPGTERTIILS